MMDFLSKFKVFASFLIAILVLLIGSCTDDDDITRVEEEISELSFVDSSLPEVLNANEGSVRIELEWSYTEWQISNEVVEGDVFITGISPDSGGDADEGATTSYITISYKANNQSSENKQKLILSSLDGDLSDEIILTQSGTFVQSTLVSVDHDVTHQTISGFGGANMIWGSDYLNSGEMDMAFGTDENGLGLSIYRVRLSSNQNEWSGLVNSIKGANDRNVTVLASPWSPPAKWKSNNSINGGGYLLKEHYADFANYINEYIQFMADEGATVDVVSIQNEPDWEVGYEGCEYTVSEMYDFVKNHAGSIEGAKVLAAESLNSNHAYTDDILNDPVSVDNIDIVGGHLYGSGLAAYPLAEQKNKEVWMTEHLMNLNSGNIPNNWLSTTDPDIIWDETMDMVEEIHSAMSYNWNAYIWWYIRRYYSFLGDGDNGTQRGEILKRGYAFSHFSKFVRPGYQRIDVGAEGASSLKMTAYSGNGETVIVVINPSEHSTKTIEVSVPSSVNSATAYSTSIDFDREKFDNVFSDDKIVVDLPVESITTIVVN